MKKIKVFTLIFITVCLCTFFFSCKDNTPCEHEYDNECDNECNICSEKRAVLSHFWHTVDQELCEYKSTCAWCGLTMGENVEHSYIDENGNTLSACISCGHPNPDYN